MIAKQGFNQLLADVLSIQPERDDLGLTLTDERIKEVVWSDSSFTDEEKKILRTSPEARIRLSIEHDKIRRKQLIRWHDAGVDQCLQWAADSNMDDLKYEGADFTLKIYPLNEKTTWAIIIQIKEKLLNASSLVKAVRLVDDGGFIWVSGKIDDYKEVTGYWKNGNETPLERMAKHKLSLEPI